MMKAEVSRSSCVNCLHAQHSTSFYSLRFASRSFSLLSFVESKPYDLVSTAVCFMVDEAPYTTCQINSMYAVR